MKGKTSIIIAIFISSIGLTAYDINRSSGAKECGPVSNNQDEQTETFANVFNTGFNEATSPPAKKAYYYSVRVKYNRSITKEKLSSAKLIEDVLFEYPSSWVNEYESIEILSLHNGIENSAKSPNNILSQEQKDLFNTIEIGDDYVVLAKFKSMNVVTNKLEDREINVSMSVVPEVEAEFIGGYDNLIEYLEVNSINEISNSNFDLFYLSTIQFVVNEKGAIENVKLIRSSGSEKADEMMLETISTMPAWKPAEDADGNKVSQKLFFNSGIDGC